ncbi:MULTISPECIES: ACP S-malonyltransferase [Streptomycetaceae]|uniref:[acyl-carrier-protein] S-malonyltransferase n=1 Tax=Streptantibioticus cattleyicolor (strain ATCC 35852 / DSM 46488 / JCM 4925 / NBRC 14057 / NRRL 8057) TaxID=1003195 RepID=F8K3X9_STREN|nr:MULTISPECIES: ACP S-malonyltransferase [Streptomycetaceae]AEW95946.1 putative acyltransferase [Streptantibioticus cattleyicolor NRRL 8057 = DSM 46488]MYS60481.1 ACP S-malonyltransferase [Streptomyces sp. SID5468]CCB76280.1 putative acyltransferase [Streptantibioticus cattleyicolor NRRL 8057 = DSM 46488]
MTRRNVFMFAGQGSQYHHMGRWLYEHDEVFRATLLELDGVVRAERGDSVLDRIYGTGLRLDEPFDRFRDSQPGIFMIEYALARSLAAHGLRPDLVLGASLGEVAAAAVAEAVDVHECLTLLVRQVRIFEERCPPGGMLAVLAEPSLLHRTPVLHERLELAAVNSAANFVLAGAAHELDRAEEWLTGQGVLFQRLPVPFAFHSSHIEAVREEFTAQVARLRLRPPRVPLLSGTTGGEVSELDVDHIWQVMRRPFDLRPLVDRLLREDRDLCLDLGPSGSMANLVNGAAPAGATVRALPLLSPFSHDGALLEKALAYRAPAAPAPPPAPSPSPVPPTSEGPQMTRRTAPPLRVHLFPGQGSQVKGMGKELFDRFPELTATADRVLGHSIRTLCVEDPERRLKQTEFTQPALYVVGALSHLAALQEGGRLPDYALGHSLGEYVALFAAGVYDFATGLRLVAKRGELMSRASGGTMAAVAGCDVELVRKVLADGGLDALDVANYNAPTQTVIAGPKEVVEQALPLFTEAGARCVPLNVSAPFHSRYMAAAAEEFGRFLDGFDFHPPKIPVIANVDARPYRDAADVKDKLRRQIDGPVRWTDSVRYLMGQGELDVRELGPGTVLTKLVARIEAEATPLLPAEPERPAAPVAAPSASRGARTLGSAAFREAYGVSYAYVAGGMHHGITSPEFVARMAGAGFLAFLGTAGLPAAEVERAVRRTRELLGGDGPFGVNLTYSPFGSGAEDAVVDAALGGGVRFLEASTYVQITPALVRYRLRGAKVTDGRARAPHKLLAKVTRPDVARLFFAPPPPRIVERLLGQGAITAEEAAAAPLLAMADDVCAVGDAGGYTDMGVLAALLPSVRRLRDEAARERPAVTAPRVGAGGGIGTPETAAAAFLLGADFVLTGSVNVCTAESGVGDRAKDLLQALDVHDTTYAPYGDLFELGGRARVMKKGVLFHARANKLYDLWRTHDDWQRVDPRVRAHVEERYFGEPFDSVYARLRAQAPAGEPEPDPKRRMALVFRWYCDRAARLAVTGEAGHEMDYQVACGPALGACNQWLRGTGLESWRDRHADEVGRRVMAGAGVILEGR